MAASRMRQGTWRFSSPADLWNRYRGVAILVSIPVLLVAAVLLIMPRTGPQTYTVVTDSKEGVPVIKKTSDGVEDPGEAVANAGSADALSYAVIIDAGSTGSRVHVYKFEMVNGQLDFSSDTFEQLKPGLSSYDSDADSAAKSLDPLLKTAVQTVPEELQARTPIKVGATAGLRLLDGSKSEDILAAVRKHLASYPFQIDDVSIIDGTEEGGYAWLTINYLLGKLGAEKDDTVAVVDLGGGSVQMAYAMSEAQAKKAPDGYIQTLSGGGKTYHVYMHSYLGFGLMAARAAVLEWADTASANPCVPADASGSYTYAGKEHKMLATKSGASLDACSKLVSLVMGIGGECGVPKNQLAECAFNGTWGGGKLPAVFYISSYFWDRATDVGVIKDPDAINVNIKPSDFRAYGNRACAKPISQLGAEFPSVQEEQRPYLCMDLSYCYKLLTEGFKVPEKAKITIVKRIKYKKEDVEAAWPLGAAINLLSKA